MQNPLLRKLFVLIYFAVIIVFPLSNVHVEIVEENTAYLSETADGDSTHFITLIHKVFCLYLGNIADYLSYSPGKSLAKGFFSKNLYSKATKYFTSFQTHCNAEYLLFVYCLFCIYSAIWYHRTRDCIGMYSSWSYLSPPSSFLS